MLPEQPTLLELGAGSGSLFRWLAPIVGRTQHWLWLDNDDALLERGIHLTAHWAQRLGYAVQRSEEGTELTLQTPRGTWSIEARGYDLNDPPSMLPLDEADAVTCSAVLDLFSEDWLDELLHAIVQRPFYAAINVIGRDRIRPHRLEDELIWRGYILDQVGNARLLDPLGPDVPNVAREVCKELGLQYVSTRSDWIIRRQHHAMLRYMIGFVTNAARQALPQYRRRVDRWERRRRQEIAAGRCTLRIGHVDVLVSVAERAGKADHRRRKEADPSRSQP